MKEKWKIKEEKIKKVPLNEWGQIKGENGAQRREREKKREIRGKKWKKRYLKILVESEIWKSKTRGDSYIDVNEWGEI